MGYSFGKLLSLGQKIKFLLGLGLGFDKFSEIAKICHNAQAIALPKSTVWVKKLKF